MDKKTAFKYFGIALLTFALPLAIYLLGQKTTFFNRAFGELLGVRAELTVNLTDSYNISDYSWKNFSQGGEEQQNMLAPVREQIKSLQPNYIRIDHIYDFYKPVERNADGILTFNWTKLDAEIANITVTGAKPFISLSYMPNAITTKDEVSVPQSWQEWQLVVQKTIEHVSGREGLKITDAYYEVWNEPDLFGGFKINGDNNYLTMYLHASRGAQSAANTMPFKLGGPATTALYRNWFDSLLQYAEENNLRLDFYSWHKYGKKLSDYESDMREVKEWLQVYPRFSSLEFVITESGPNSDPDPVYDSEFSAFHALATSVVAFDNNVKIFSFELKDGPGETMYRGRWGLMTHESFGPVELKPRYKAYQFINQMKGKKYVVYGTGTWVKAIATNDGKVIKTLLVNYDQFVKHNEAVPIHFVNVPYRNFIYRRTDFLGRMTERTVELESLNWTVYELLEPNSAAILEIIPK